MKASLRLCSIFDIAIHIHITFLFLPLMFGYLYGVKGVVFICAVFFWVTLHELMHSVLAKHYGITVRSIVLLPIGGVAALTRQPRKPREEFMIAIAGPLMNFALAGVLWLPVYCLIGPWLFHPGLDSWPQTISYIFWVNPWLGFFNLLPAFPMDGGRVVRALLATRLSFRKATQIAVNLGHVFAFLFAFWGFFIAHSFMPVILALFIYVAAAQEEEQVEISSTLEKFSVRDIVAPHVVTVYPAMTTREVVELMVQSRQEDFPVMSDNALCGLITRGDIIDVVHAEQLERVVGDYMRCEYPTVQMSDSLLQVQEVMNRDDVKAVPVLADGVVRGIISLEDIGRVYSLMGRNKHTE